jgi:hypothetical protein
VNVDTQIELIEKRRDHVQKFTEEELNQELATQTALLDEQLSANLLQVEQAKNKQLASINTSFEKGILDDIDRLMAIRDGYYRDWTSEKSVIEDRFTATIVGNVTGSKDERGRLLAELNALKAEMKAELDDSNFLTRSGVDKKYRALISEKESQLGAITTGYLGGDALEKQSLMENQLRQQIEFVNTKYQRRVNDVNERIDNKKKEIGERYSKNSRVRNAIINRAKKDKSNFFNINEQANGEVAQYEETKRVELEDISQRVFKYDEQIFELRNEQRLLNTQISHLISQNQVYRLAMYAYGKNDASEVDRHMVGVVALFWFGSLALIAAVTGVMLALASFYLRRFAVEMDDKQKKQPQLFEMPEDT